MLPMIIIAGERINPGRVWVQLQRPKGEALFFYTVDVPLSIADVVFGDRNPHFSSWADQIWHDVGEYGTFEVDGYFENIAKLANQELAHYQWVIASVDDVQEVDSMIRVSGCAVPFNRELGAPELYPLK